MISAWRVCVFVILGLILSGCAEVPMVMSLNAGGADVVKVWPAPPDDPRYLYAGELTGEENFHPDATINRGTAQKLFDWITGLSSSKPSAVVLQRPQSGVVGVDSRIYVTDVSKGAIYVFDKSAGRLEVWEMAQVGVHFKTPVGVTLTSDGGVLVADADLHGVFKLDRKGLPQAAIGLNDLKRPTGVARDPNSGVIYVSDTYAHDIKMFDEQGRLIKVVGQRGEAAGEFNFPTYLAFSAGKLYVTDTLNSRIQILSSEGEFLSQFGERGLYVGNLVRPKGVAVDKQGNIYVIESLYDQLLVFNNKGQTLLALGGSGNQVGQFYLPAGVWVDDKDYVYIADMFNGRVVVLQPLGGSVQ